MVLLDGGTFLMGTDDKIGFVDDGEGPFRTGSIASARLRPSNPTDTGSTMWPETFENGVRIGSVRITL